ncbi:MAG: hypothetical protein QM703_28715 [Gemmatales bacterium]
MIAIDWIALAVTFAIIAVAVDLSRYKGGRDQRKTEQQAKGLKPT